MTFNPLQDKPIERIVPYKKLQDIEGYISIQDGKENYVMKVIVSVLKVVKLEGVKAPDGKPAFNFQSANNATLLTPEEYKIMTGRSVEP